MANKLKKPKIFSIAGSKRRDLIDPIIMAKSRFLSSEGINLALNSLGAQHKNAHIYSNIYFKHWEKYQVEGHFEPMAGIGKKPTGYADFREMFRDYSVELLGARYDSETAIVNDQSATYGTLFEWLVQKQLRRGRTIVLYEANGAFPSDNKIITEAVRIMNINSGKEGRKIKLVAIPQTEDGLIDHEALLRLILKIGSKLAVAAFGSGGIHWNTAQMLDMRRIGPLVNKAGGKTLVNVAHALGIVDLQLHKWKITAAVGCGYKFLSAGAGGPSLVFIHKTESTSMLSRVGWFSFEDPISTLQGKHSHLKKGAQRIEASNPMVLGWLPFYAALEEYFKWGKAAIHQKGEELLQYSDELMLEVQNQFHNPITVITPKNERSTEFVFTTKDRKKAALLHKYLNDYGIICDMRDSDKIRIGMFALITTRYEVCKLYNTIWDFFENQK